MATTPIVVLHIGPLDADRKAYPLRYFAETDYANPAAEEWILSAPIEDDTRTWSRQKILARIEDRDPALPKAREIGEYLASLVEIGRVGAAWKARRQAVRGQGHGALRVALDVEAKELRALPWELMFSDNTWLFRDLEVPMYRAVRSPNQPEPEALPLRVLVVVGATDEEKDGIKWDREIEGLRRGLRASGAEVELEEAIRPDSGALVTMIERVKPHVFHFIGHGEMAGNPIEPALVFSNGHVRYWKASDMRQDFAQAGWRPPVVLFNACRSAAAKENATELARVLIEDGTCCVVGMQGDIQGAASAAFAASLYASIVKYSPIDVAIAAARIAVNRAVNDTRDWALPAVYVSCAPDEALPSTFVPNAQAVIEQFARRYRELADFVDRRDERREVCSMFLGGNQQGLRHNLVVLYGSSKIGKSDLVRWCTRHLALRGRNVHYVDLKTSGNSGATEDVLGAIRRGAPGAPDATLGALPDVPFRVFDRKLEALKSKKPEGSSEPIGQLCATFMDGLRELTRTDEWLIILDHFEFKPRDPHDPRDLYVMIELTDFEAYLKDAVFVPVADGQLPNLKLLLVMRDDEVRDNAGGIVGKTKIHIQPWDGKLFEWLARQFVIEALEKDRDTTEQVLAMYEKKRIDGQWRPTQLGEVRTAVDVMVPK